MYSNNSVCNNTQKQFKHNFTSDSLQADTRQVDSHWVVDNRQQPVEDNLAAHMQVEDELAARTQVEGIQQQRDMVDQGVTFAGRVELPLVVGQTCRRACPFQSCVVSDIQTERQHFHSRTHEPKLLKFGLLTAITLFYAVILLTRSLNH